MASAGRRSHDMHAAQQQSGFLLGCRLLSNGVYCQARQLCPTAYLRSSFTTLGRSTCSAAAGRAEGSGGSWGDCSPQVLRESQQAQPRQQHTVAEGAARPLSCLFQLTCVPASSPSPASPYSLLPKAATVPSSITTNVWDGPVVTCSSCDTTAGFRKLTRCSCLACCWQAAWPAGRLLCPSNTPHN